MSNEITSDDIAALADYALMFYGKGELHALEPPMTRTEALIGAAQRCSEEGLKLLEWLGGDSMDREVVRDLVLCARGGTAEGLWPEPSASWAAGVDDVLQSSNP